MRLPLCALFSLVFSMDVELITRNNCVFSEKMRGFLAERNIRFVDHNVSREGLGIKRLRGVESATYPAVFVNGEYIGGYVDAVGSGIFEQVPAALSANPASADAHMTVLSESEDGRW